ncbi:MAG: glycosyltransferase [Cyanobacteria bacterium P01_F01_bin.153]
MRIALFTETFLPKIDGIVTRLRHTIDNLKILGDELIIVTPEAGLKEYQGFQVHGVPGVPLPMYPELKMAFPRPSIGETLDRFEPDLVHIVNPAILGLGGLFYAKQRNLPLVASYHTHLPQYLHHYGLGFLEGVLWEMLKAGHNQADINLCTSTAMVRELSDHGIKRTDLWQRGVDTETFHPHLASREMRDRLTEGNPDSPLLLYVGRLSAEKEIDRICPVLEAIPNARLALVGDGPYREGLEEIYKDTPTYFAGYMRGVELATAYASADAFIFPSRTETLGLVLLEAMAAGCPVVAARAGGIPDIVTDGENGFMFDPADEDGAIKATQALLANQINREKLRKAARAEAERWGWNGATRQLQRYYNAVIDGRSRPMAA